MMNPIKFSSVLQTITILLLSGLIHLTIFQSGIVSANEVAPEYFDQLQTERNENWFQKELRTFRTYPYLNRAYELIEEENYPAAKTELEKFLERDPENLQVQYTYLILLSKMDHAQNTLIQVDHILTTWQQFVPAMIVKGNILIDQGKKNQAINTFQDALSVPNINQQDREYALNTLFHLYYEQQDYNNALKTTNQLLSQHNTPQLIIQKSIVLESMGKPLEAFNALLEALDLIPDQTDQIDVIDSLITLALKTETPEQTRTAFTTLYNKIPQNSQLLRAMAEFEYTQQNFSQAITWLEQLLNQTPNSQDRLFLANLFYNNGNLSEALNTYGALLKTDDLKNEYFQIYLSLGFIHDAQTNYQAAFNAFRQAYDHAQSASDKTNALSQMIEIAKKNELSSSMIQEIQSLLPSESSDPDILFALAEMEYIQGNNNRAVTLTDQSLAIQPNPRRTEFLANVLIQQQNYSRAVHELNTLKSQYTNDADLYRLYTLLGNASVEMKDYTQAKNHYTQALSLSQTETEKIFLYAKLLELARLNQDNSEVQKYLNQVMGLESTDETQLRSFVDSAYANQNYAVALTLMEKLIDEDATLEEKKFYANLLYLNRQYELAANQYQSLLAQTNDPNKQYELYRSMGYSHSKRNAYQQTAEAFDKANRIKPSKDLLEELVRVNNLLNRTQQAQAYQKQILELEPSIENHFKIAYMAVQQGKQEEALYTFRKIIQIAPQKQQQATAYKEIAYLNLKNNNKPDAITHFERALQLTPNDADIHLNLAQLYIEVQRYDQAILHYQQALKTRDSADNRLTLAYLYVLQENNEQAKQAYLQLLDHPTLNQSQKVLVYNTLLTLFTNNDQDSMQQTYNHLITDNLPTDTKAELADKLGRIYYQQENLPKAQECFEYAINAGREDLELYQYYGFLLYRQAEYEQAFEQFQIINDTQSMALPLAYMGFIYNRLQKPGVAVHYLEQALAHPDSLTPADQKLVMDTLGYLYFEEAQYPKAITTWEKSLQSQFDPVISFQLSKTYRIVEDYDQALNQLLTVHHDDLPTELQPFYHEEYAIIYHQLEEFQLSIDYLNKINEMPLSADRSHLLGQNYRALNDNTNAIVHFEQAVEQEPKNNIYILSLAYTYYDEDRFQEAEQHFQVVKRRNPHYIELPKVLGYTNMKQIENDNAVHYFKEAIDNKPYYPVHTPEEENQLEKDIYKLRREVGKLNNRFDLDLYQTYRTDSQDPSITPGGLLGGTLPSQGGAELSWTPPEIGFRDERVFQVYARLLWNNEENSLDFEEESFQGGLGLRYKPFKTHNLKFSVERLFAIGDDALDDWMLRNIYSWDLGYDLKFNEPWWNYTFFLEDGAYFVDESEFAVYGEFRQGVSFNLDNKFLITPHLVVDGRYQSDHNSLGSFWEAGAGVSLRYFFNETTYEAPRSNIEFLLQYKFGDFFDTPSFIEADSFSGLVLTGILHF